MPAITVDDILVLPRVPEPGLAETERTVTSVTTAPSGYEGEEFPVRRGSIGSPGSAAGTSIRSTTAT